MEPWLTITLTMLPLLLLVYLGLGLPWALTLLPRRDWADRPLLLCLALAMGPTLLSVWMFMLGSAGPLLRLDLILGGVIVIAMIGTVLAWRKRKNETIQPEKQPLALDERLLLVLMALAFLLRIVAIAFWPFTAYDALWVYGYEGRLYTLLHQIPAHIAYYPQFMPLQYSFAQLLVGGIDDHAARAVIVFTHLGSMLAVYVLGSRLFTRRVGIIVAALWALYPHVGEWARFGDLEIPLAFLFTAATTFFLMAWTQVEYRRRYALIAGILLGAAMWTKPTAGAFIWSVLLLLAVELWRLRFDWRAWLPRFEITAITGLASIPLGAVWYIRNALLSHAVIDFPPDFWLTQALRSGREFGWPLLTLLLLLAYMHFGPFMRRPAWRESLIDPLADGLPLIGTGRAGSQVEIVLNGEVVDTVTVGEDGTWSYAAIIDAPGDYELSLNALDADGNVVASSEPVSFTVEAPAEETDAITGSTSEDIAEIVCEEEYVVIADDWLSKLADKYWSDLFLYPAIVTATNQKQQSDGTFATIDDVDLIEPGWKLCIVDAATAAQLVEDN